MPEFLINTFSHWDEPPRARHQVAMALAKKYKVTFVAANKFGLPGIKSISVSENLEVLIPYFPVINKIRYRIPFINEVYQLWLFWKLRSKYNKREVINFDYTATLIFKFFNNVIYYCNDSFLAISNRVNPSFIARYHRYCESKVASRSKFCVAVSGILRDKLRVYNDNSIEIPLGSPDVNEYNIPVNPVARNKNILEVGLVGFMNVLIISPGILDLLLQEDNIRLTIIGPADNKFLNLIENRHKLILKGPMMGKALYEEINKFDVTIAPYCKKLSTDINSGVGTGSKMYHYFAMGKPVVIRFMPGLSKISLPEKFIYIAHSEEEFSSLIFKAHEENTEELIRQRISFAESNTWEKRMEQLVTYYNNGI